MNILNHFTLRSLAKNRTRTLVTIIGIALSAAMFTAVTSIIVSFQQYMFQMEVATDGAWEGKMQDCSRKLADAVGKQKEVKSCTVAAQLGYSKLEKSDNEDKPYLFVMGIREDFTDFSPIYLTEGRMPKNENELVIPKHLEVNGGVEYKVGDTLNLQLGKRVYETGESKGMPAGGQDNSFYPEQKEKLVDVVSRTYKVVGICERPNYEEYSAPGYTAFTLDHGEDAQSYDVMMTFHNSSKADDLLEQYLELDDEEASLKVCYSVHGALLRYTGNSTDEGYNRVLYSMGFILMAIIVIGSISLIYNAFSISVSERTRQFGLLKSIGATRKQMRNSVLFEALALSLAGIPLGILAGIGGIGITLHYVSGLVKYFWSPDRAGNVQLTLVFTWQSILLAAVIGLITVLISAMIPAHKAVKLPAIQAIRQNGDVRIRPQKVRTSSLTYLLFGFEGMLASKNFKRNRKKHRTTVFSLFISIVLFITATSFSEYLKDSQSSYVVKDNCDLSFSLDEDAMGEHTAEEVMQGTESIATVDEASYSRMSGGFIQISKDYINKEYLEFMEAQDAEEGAADSNVGEEKDDGETVSMPVVYYFVRDSVYRDYLEKEGLDTELYMDAEEWTPLVWDRVNTYYNEKIFSAHVLKETGWSETVNFVRRQKGYYYMETKGDVCVFEEETAGDGSGHRKEIPVQDACFQKKITLGQTQDGDLPLGVSDVRWEECITMVLPYSATEKNDMGDVAYMESLDCMVRAKEHKKAYEQLSEYLSDGSFGTGAAASLYDQAESAESDRALVLVIDIFSYGFIVLISLISIANVFNTISTNVQLRRQEFAMLKSVGMTGKGFDKMMNYECALYGVKALLYGVPVSLVVSWFMYRSMAQGWNSAYMFPWQGILIVAVSVFVVVFATMLYSMSKIKKDNPIEALRNENL